MHSSKDTIAAIATATGRAGIGIIRVSGERAAEIARTVTKHQVEPGHFFYSPFWDAEDRIVDYGIALYFANPASYTGEDVFEFQGHGGPAVLDVMLQHILSLGVRQSRAGEFTERAFLNDKLDLAQAEAVSDLINSASAGAAKAAIRSLNGEFSTRIRQLVEQLIDLRVFVEAALDFAEEEIDFLSSDELRTRAGEVEENFSNILLQAQRGRVLKDGITLVIAGAPNVGKSSLLNRLTGADSAIVTPIAGTTRDVLREHIHLDGLPLHILDTAGIRDSDDPVEREGVRRARAEIHAADRILWVTDEPDSTPDPDTYPADKPVDLVFNKIDLTGQVATIDYDQTRSQARIALSAKTGAGMDLLIEHLKRSVGYEQDEENVFLARNRHIVALESAHDATRNALDKLQTSNQPELAAEDLRLAQNALNEITGEFTSDDLLGRIFASFCIGK